MEGLKDNWPMSPDTIPEAWFHDERMNSMFAEFRNRSVNPQDWDSKFKFWDDLITNWLSYKYQCLFSTQQLSSAFKRKGRTPLCIPTMLEELHKKGEIITVEQFLNEIDATWSSWAMNTIIKKPVIWSFSKVKNYLIPKTINPDMKYVHIQTIKQLTDLILSLATDEQELILSLPELTKKCSEKSGNKNITEENVKLALLWLSKTTKNLRLQHYQEKWECLLKISSIGVENLTEADEGLFKLEENERIISEKIRTLEIERNGLLVKAKSSLNNGLKEVAKTHIRKKREIDQRIAKHVSVLQNLHTLISNIHDAHSNTEVLAAYKKGTEILKNLGNTGFNEFTVRDTMDDMTEVVEELQEIQSVLSEPLNVTDSNLELEEELREILNSSTSDMTLPNVPDTSLPDFEKQLESLKLQDFPLPTRKIPDQKNQGIPELL